MRWVYEQIERHMLSVGYGGAMMAAPRIYPLSLIEACLARIEAARRKAADNPALLARIDRDKNCLEATRLWCLFCLSLPKTTSNRQEAVRACQAYLEFVRRLDGTLTLGGGARVKAEKMLRHLKGPGTYFREPFRPGRKWPGRFKTYSDDLDRGGKSFHAKSCTGFRAGPYGLYLKPHTTGEIIYDMRTAAGMRFKQAYLPKPGGSYETALRMALPKGGHNAVQVSLDQGKTWITAFEDLHDRGKVRKYGKAANYDLTPHVGGKNQFLLKFRVQNPTDGQILGLNCWVFTGSVEWDKPADRAE